MTCKERIKLLEEKIKLLEEQNERMERYILLEGLEE